MNIIIKGADFSANNIGRVSLPYSEFTNQIIEAYGTAFTVNQKAAINSFTTRMKNSGILDKITKLYLPVLSSALDKSFINIVSPSLSVDVVPNASYWELVNNGIKNVSPNTATAAALNVNLGTSNRLYSNDFHCLSFNNETLSVTEDIVKPYASNVMYLNWTWRLNYGAKPSSANFIIGTTNLSNLFPGLEGGTLYVSPLKRLKGVSMLTNTTAKTYDPSEKTLALTSSFTPTAVSGTVNIAGYNNSSCLKPHGLISIGKGLTASEILLYSDYVNSLMAAFGVIAD